MAFALRGSGVEFGVMTTEQKWHVVAFGPAIRWGAHVTPELRITGIMFIYPHAPLSR